MLRSAALFLVLVGVPLLAGEIAISKDSVMAVITHKDGIAKGLAHNHFVYAGAYKAKLSTADSPLDLALEITLQTTDLVVDDKAVSDKWYPRLEELGLLAESFSELDEKDRGKIRKAMLGKSQLNEAKHKQMEIKLLEVTAEASEVNGIAFAYKIKAAFTIVGETAEATLAANINHDSGKLAMEAIGSLSFSAFGIKPYSALLGAISNQDSFDLYLSIKAE